VVGRRLRKAADIHDTVTHDYLSCRMGDRPEKPVSQLLKTCPLPSNQQIPPDVKCFQQGRNQRRRKRLLTVRGEEPLSDVRVKPEGYFGILPKVCSPCSQNARG
jgi:hypothetical protein